MAFRSLSRRFLLFAILFTLVTAFTAPLFSQSPIEKRDPAYVNIVGMIPLPTEQLSSRLVFFFDREIDIERIPKQNLIAFEPAIEDWEMETGANYIAFYLKKWDLAKQYKVRLSPKIRSKDGLPLNPEQREYTFSAQPLRLDRSWVIQRSRTHFSAGLQLNYPVSQEDLAKHLVIMDKENKELNYTLDAGPERSMYHLRLHAEALAWPLHLHIEPGLTDRDRSVKLMEPITQTFEGWSRLNVMYARWDRIEKERQVIDLRFSEPVASSDLKEHLVLKTIPGGEAMEYKVLTEGEKNRHKVAIQAEDLSRLNMEVRVNSGLRGENESYLQSDYTTKLQHRIKPLSIERDWWNYSNQGLILNLRFNENIRNFVSQNELIEYVEVVPAIENLKVEYGWRANQIRIYGDWKSEYPYQVNIKAGLPYHKYAELRDNLIRPVKTRKIRPHVGFTLGGEFYFPRRTGLALPFETRNVDRLHVTLYKLFPNNIPAAFDHLNRGKGSNYFFAKWAQNIEKTELTIDGPAHKTLAGNLDLDSLFPQTKKGVFCVYAQSESRSTDDTKIVLYTDIGAVSHWTDNELVLFTHDLFDLSPIANARVTVYSNKSQVLAQKRTDGKGIVHFREFDASLGNPDSVVIEKGDDFTFLLLKKRGDRADEMKSNMPVYNPEAYDAFVYADRELYRPGETIHARWLVRNHYGDAVQEVPLKVTVLKPNGKKMLSRPITLSQFGTGAIDIETEKIHPTGLYEIHVSVPGETSPIGRAHVRLEEFVPQRMKAEVSLNEDTWLPGEEYKIHVQANHLFGPPAQDRKCETRIVFQRGGYKPEQWSEYTFTNDSNVSAPKGQPLGEQWTDANGQASFPFRYTPDDNITFPMRAMAVSDVFELGGRAVSGRASATYLPAKTLLGLTASSRQGEAGVAVHVAAINAEEAPAAIESVSVTLEREIWNYHVRRYRSHNQLRWEKSYQEVETQSVALQEGRGSTHFALNSQWGHYRVRVHSKETRHYSTLSFFTYGGGIQLRESATPELVKLEMDQPKYTIGDTARLRIESPFDGTAFVVLQGETIYDKIPVKIEGNTGMLEIPLKQEYYPNLWIECTMIHKVESGESQAHPYSSFAVKNIELEDPKRGLTVSFPDLPEEIRPETRHTFTVSVKDRNEAPVKAELTLAAIDEGIHAITGYQTPEPLAYFSRARRPDFRRAHYYDQVVYDFEKLRPGGDAALRMAEQVSTPLENWIQPVALWSGTVTTGEDGLAEVEMDVPDFNGQFRLVVVACTQKAVGAQDEHVYIRRPYMLRTSVPRFMLPGDAMNSTLVVFNQTETDCQATVRWNAQGALQATEGKMDVAVPAKGEARVNAHFLAKEIIGQGTVEWKAAIYDREGQTRSQLSETLPLPVLPPAAYQSHHKLIVLEPGKQIELRQEGIRPDPRNRVELVVSANPALRVQEALSYLIDYPYGCIEQTISRLMPLYLLKQNQELMKSIVPNTQIDEYLRAGIEKLFAMQTASGGLAYWPGSNSPHAYGSVYALHFLTLVKNSRQFEVSDDGFKALQGYVWGIAENWSQFSKSALFQRAYALYVLALGGDTRALNQIQRFDELLIPRASRYLLAAALALQTQDRERVDTYLATAPSEPYTQRELGGTFNSPMRNRAIELMSLRQIGGHKQRQAELANELIRFLETEGRGNTQETAFVVTALGGYLSDLAKNISQTGCTIEGPAGMEQLAGLDVYRDEHKGVSAPYLVRNTGETNIYVSHAVHGVPIQPATQAVSEGMSVDRVFYLDGEEKQSRSYEQGETYVIRLTLHCEYDLENVIVADLLPAGFEVENPRLDPNAVPDMKMENPVHPSHLEIRDDRVVLAFNTLKKGRYSFYYIARAVTKGRYQHPPLNAECMYDPKIHAKTAPAVIEVD